MSNSISTTIRSYSWSEMDQLCNKLADEIIASGFQPEIIIGITRGGCFPALILSHRFQIRDLYTINVTTTINDAVRASKIKPMVHSVSGLSLISAKSVLLVDDVTNSGATLKTAKSAIGLLNPHVLRVACPIWDIISDSGKIHS